MPEGGGREQDGPHAPPVRENEPLDDCAVAVRLRAGGRDDLDPAPKALRGRGDRPLRRRGGARRGRPVCGTRRGDRPHRGRGDRLRRDRASAGREDPSEEKAERAQHDERGRRPRPPSAAGNRLGGRPRSVRTASLSWRACRRAIRVLCPVRGVAFARYAVYVPDLVRLVPFARRAVRVLCHLRLVLFARYAIRVFCPVRAAQAVRLRPVPAHCKPRFPLPPPARKARPIRSDGPSHAAVADSLPLPYARLRFSARPATPRSTSIALVGSGTAPNEPAVPARRSLAVVRYLPGGVSTPS